MPKEVDIIFTWRSSVAIASLCAIMFVSGVAVGARIGYSMVEEEKVMFWHQPTGLEVDVKWHAYDFDGKTLCKKYTLIGFGRPNDAADTLPKEDLCEECLRKLNDG